MNYSTNFLFIKAFYSLPVGIWSVWDWNTTNMTTNITMFSTHLKAPCNKRGDANEGHHTHLETRTSEVWSPGVTPTLWTSPLSCQDPWWPLWPLRPLRLLTGGGAHLLHRDANRKLWDLKQVLFGLFTPFSRFLLWSRAWPSSYLLFPAQGTGGAFTFFWTCFFQGSLFYYSAKGFQLDIVWKSKRRSLQWDVPLSLFKKPVGFFLFFF